jgi:hypothetical protein
MASVADVAIASRTAMDGDRENVAGIRFTKAFIAAPWFEVVSHEEQPAALTFGRCARS